MGRAHEVRKAAMEKTNAAKTKVYSKFGKEILLAAKSGVPDPDMNLSLRRTIERAKKAQVPADIIKRAIERAKSGSGEDYTVAIYEGFGPGASTVIVECLTDNLNRSVSSVRSTITKNKGKLGIGGSVMHNYNHVSLVSCTGVSEDQALEALLMAEIDVKSVETDEDLVIVYGEPNDRDSIKETLESIEGATIDSAETTYVPENDEYVTLEGEDKELFVRMLQMLEDIEDVQEVYHNVDL